ncbi:MAG TPA: hypothetical protein PK689_07665, partial [Kiritimatiellia bacterium]|nr:hypothetical protein [Kiritimatiellia bacterium]
DPAAASARPLLELAETNRGHAETPETLRRTRAWMVRWLAPQNAAAAGAVRDPSPDAEPPERLACLGQVPTGAANFTVHRTFVPAHALAGPMTADEWNARRPVLMELLRTKVFGWFPESEEIPFRSRKAVGSGGHARRFARFSEWEFDSEPGDRVRVQLFEPHRAPVDAPLLVVVRRRVDSLAFPDDELLPLLSDHRLLILVPRFGGWNPAPAERAAAERMAALCGRTLDALQVWDVLRAVRWALDERGFRPSGISLLGREGAGVVALYAALFEPRIGQVIMQRPPASHAEGPSLLGILRITDIPEVAGLLAPRGLTLVGAVPAAFSMVQDLYRAAGAARKCRTVDSPVAALRGSDGGTGSFFSGTSRDSKE